MPAVSYIISARPQRQNLLNCITSIYLQYESDPDNYNEIFVIPFKDHKDQYNKINEITKLTTGDYLCFPNDDCYLVPGFTATLLATAKNTNAQLIYCDILYDPRLFGRYEVLRTEPKLCRIDKICYIIKRELFIDIGGFPDSQDVYYTDGHLIERLVTQGVSIAKAPGVLAVHN